MEITERGTGPSGCVQNREMARAGARAATGVTGINSSGICFFYFLLLLFLPWAYTHTPGHTPHIEQCFKEVSPQGWLGFLAVVDAADR